MDVVLVMKTAAVLFGIAALGGLVMAAIRFSGKPRPPSSLAMLHGLLAGAGLTLLIYAGYTASLPPMARIAGGVLLLAAVGGIWLNLRYHSRQLPLPIPVVVIHALAAVVGFGLLLTALVSAV
jgi:hypothetical protein